MSPVPLVILMKQNIRRAHTLQQSVSNQKKKKRNEQWMDTAASALSELAKGAASSSIEDDEWDVFGKNVANSLRAIKSEDLQRRANCAVQTAIFQTTEHAMQQQASQPAAASNLYTCINAYEGHGTNYHNF